ncbi:MAG: ATP-binding cassette domain-containing protein [Candidatus Magnetoovum sp. WYHC-5]|nr:ATP-binding cassette domain-containing protein [Candidatus Magnetoovum sp. WYHC-5]
MSSECLVELKDVWKKYPYKQMFHRSIREDIVNVLKPKNNLDLKDNEFWALKSVNLQLLRGKCVCFFGPNGAGKTTILKLIASVTYPTIGEVEVKERVAPLIEVGAGFHPDLTGRENVYVNGTIIGMHIKEIKEKMADIIAFSELEKFIDMPVKKYSSGMYLKLGFSIAVHSASEIILFDEILSVSDELFQKKCVGKIKELKAQGKTMVLVSHNKALLNEIGDQFVLIKNNTATYVNTVYEY